MAKDRPLWQRMHFKGNKVWQAIDQSGNPLAKNDKVLIRYQLEQDYEYWVHKNKVKPIDPSHDKRTNSGRKPSPKHGILSDPPAGWRAGQENGSIEETICDNAVCIYTDGASSGNPGPSGIGVLLRFRKHEKEISRHIGIATNNIAELEAIRVGLLEIKKNDLPIRIFTDSSYAYGVLSLHWKAKKNHALIESIKKIILKFDALKFIKVKGHAGVDGNERANLLATSAIKKLPG